MDMVKVRLRKPRRVLIFLSDGKTVHRDESCIVKTDRGLEWGTCILPPEPCPKEMEKRYSMRIVRTADEKDRNTQLELESEEKKALALCRQKVESRNMPMKLVDAEYTFDKQKYVFFFTAEDRVDFRELVRDLAHELRSRIELRHIQVRDEARLVGGIGMCGRELCCSTWLDEFKPISMRMAKKQNLSLNPSKISGQCGRLLCCLQYENDMYKEVKYQSRSKKKDENSDTGNRNSQSEERSASRPPAKQGKSGVSPEADRTENKQKEKRQERPNQGNQNNQRAEKPVQSGDKKGSPPANSEEVTKNTAAPEGDKAANTDAKNGKRGRRRRGGRRRNKGGKQE